MNARRKRPAKAKGRLLIGKETAAAPPIAGVIEQRTVTRLKFHEQPSLCLDAACQTPHVVLQIETIRVKA